MRPCKRRKGAQPIVRPVHIPPVRLLDAMLLLLRSNTESKAVQLVLKAGDDEKFMDAQLNSISGGDETVAESWQTHASGRMNMDKPTKLSNTHETPMSVQRRCTIEHTLKEFYDFMWAREYGLGPMFQLVEHIWRNDYEAVCRLTQYTAPDASSYTMYPVYFDCCTN